VSHLQEAARKKVEDDEKKVREEAEKLVCVFSLNLIKIQQFFPRHNNVKRNMTGESRKL